MTATVRHFGGGPRGAGQFSLGKPAAAFPSTIASDAQLKIAVDRLQTTLAGALDSVSTTMTVASASSIVPNMLLSIDDEIVSVTAAPSGTSVPISRSFDGTPAEVHLPGAQVSGFIDAYHHNTLVAEIEAIENALGTNLSRVPSSPILVTTTYNFPPQSPGGSLSVGTNSITLSPVPLGVNGTDQNHWLYVSGGTGTAEAVKITGGTAVAGAASGTLFIQCANTHSGAWTIQTATLGVQEAINSLPPNNSGLIYWPASSGLLYATITLPTSGVITIFGSGKTGQSGMRAPSFTAGDLIMVNGSSGSSASLNLHDLQLSNNSGFTQTGAVVNFNDTHANQSISRVNFLNGNNGIIISGGGFVSLSEAYYTNSDTTFKANAGLKIVQSASGATPILVLLNSCIFSGVISTSNPSNAMAYGMYVSCVDTILASNCDFNGDNCVKFDSVSGSSIFNILFSNCFFDNPRSANLIFSGNAGTVRGIRFTGCEFHAEAQGGNSNGACIDIGATSLTNADLIDFVGCTVANAWVDGVAIQQPTASHIGFYDCSITGNNFSASGYGGVSLTANTTGVTVQNCFISSVNGGTQHYGIKTSGNVSNCVFRGNNFQNNDGPFIFLGNFTNCAIAENLGVDNIVSTVVASAASIAAPVNPTFNVTGTTTVTTITAGWTGRRITIIKTDAGSLTIGGGGNVPGVHTLAQYGSLMLTFDGTNWY